MDGRGEIDSFLTSLTYFARELRVCIHFIMASPRPGIPFVVAFSIFLFCLVLIGCLFRTL